MVDFSKGLYLLCGAITSSFFSTVSALAVPAFQNLLPSVNLRYKYYIAPITNSSVA